MVMWRELVCGDEYWIAEQITHTIALSIRKWRNRPLPENLRKGPSFKKLGIRDSIRSSRVETVAGFYWMKSQSDNFYIGHTENLRGQIEQLLDMNLDRVLKEAGAYTLFDSGPMEFDIAPFPGVSASQRDAFNSRLVRDCHPRMNLLTHGDRAA